jgi:hypothetical protein
MRVENDSGQTKDLLDNMHSDSLKEKPYLLFQGDVEEGEMLKYYDDECKPHNPYIASELTLTFHSYYPNAVSPHDWRLSQRIF